MSYRFIVDIEPSVAEQLGLSKSFLAVQKSTPGGTKPVQWITFRVYGTEISVKWEAAYGVFFTLTDIQEGAVIEQSSKADADIDRKYKFENTKFYDIGRSDSPSAITIQNAIDVAAWFGISQISYDQSGRPISTPIAVANIEQNGRVSFTPTETVTVYFTNKYTQNGAIITVSGPSITKTLIAGVPIYLYYDGKWSQRPPPAKLALSSELDPTLPIYAFQVVLAGPLPLYAIQNYFEALLGDRRSKVSGTIFPRVYTLEVKGSDPREKLEKVVGEEIDLVIRTEISPGYYDLHGLGAVIESIVPLLTVESVLWNAVFKHAPASFKHSS